LKFLPGTKAVGINLIRNQRRQQGIIEGPICQNIFDKLLDLCLWLISDPLLSKNYTFWR
jgi:hypothetical protein